MLAAGSLAVALGAAACSPSPGGSANGARSRSPWSASFSPEDTQASTSTTDTTTTMPSPTTATSGGAASPVAEGPVTSPPLPSPGPGFVPGRVTAVGDSVMIDYQGLLQQDVPGIAVTATVSRGWTAGETVVRQLKASGQLGAVVVVGLSTNGPVTTTQFDSMMSLLTGAARVVIVNTRVDRTWQTSNNAVISAGVERYPRAVLANWYVLAAENPGWLYTTQTHFPIDGTGAAALAAQVASKV